MSLPFSPYKHYYEKQIQKWLVVHPNATLQGTDCFIVCDTEDEAKNLVEKLNEGSMKRPTEEQSGYEVILEYTPLEGRQFWRRKQL